MTTHSDNNHPPNDPHPPPDPADTPTLVVGLGASAGGLEAFKNFLQAMPADSGMALVLIQHLDPTHDSLMADILSKQTAMPVREASDGVILRPNQVHIIPPDRYLSLDGNTLRLQQPSESRGQHMAIDHFFRSLAEHWGNRGVGVVLAGTGTDGTAGIQAIKAAGGLTLAQDPDTIHHHGMPDSAIESGAVDQVLTVADMPAVLLGYARHPYTHREPRESPPADEEKGLEAILTLLQEHKGLDFRHYKSATVARRVHRRMGLVQAETHDDYLKHLRRSPQELKELLQDLMIGVTGFFRDPEAYDTLENQIVPKLMSQVGPDRPLRVWVPGCSSGEEAYSIAMLLLAHLDTRDSHSRLQVFASDIDEKALARARGGRYPGSVTADVPRRYLERFFTREGDFYQVKKVLRDVVAFSTQNLLSDPPFSRLDLIACRNVLIYLRPDTQRRVLSVFHFALRPGGYLFLGTSESIGAQGNLFKPLFKSQRLYQRIGPDRPPQRDFQPRSRPRQEPSPSSPPSRHRDRSPDLPGRVLLATCTPASIVINNRQEIQYLHGDLSDYLALPQGRPAMDLIPMLRPSLRTRVRTAVHRALRQGEPVQVMVALGDDRPAVRIRACPVNTIEQAEGYLVVSFEPVATTEALPATPDDKAGGKLIRQLEDELQATRQDLQSTVEELESANEELQSSNEEVMSSNEELQSTNEELATSGEELRSLNEELYTVNSQLREKVQELENANNDIANLLASTKIATLFLDAGFRIKRYTATASHLLRLIPTDVGCGITDLSGNLPDPLLLEDARQVLHSLEPSERELVAKDGHWYIRRILPYRTEDDHIDGVVVTFTDVTRLQRASQELDHRARQQSVVAELGLRTLGERDVRTLMHEAMRMLALTLEADYSKVLRLEPDGRSLRLVAGHGWPEGLVGETTVSAGTDSQAGYTLQMQSPVVVDDLSQELRFKGPALLTDHGVSSGISVTIQGLDGPYGVLGIHSRTPRRFRRQDVDFVQSVATLLSAAIQRHYTDQALRLSEERYRSLVSATTALVWTTGPDGGFTTPQPQWESFSGQAWEHYRSYGWLDTVHPEDRERVRVRWAQSLRDLSFYATEMRLWHHPSQRWRHCAVRAVPLLDEAGQVREWVGTISDIHTRKRAEADRERLLEQVRQAQARAESERTRLYELFMRVPALIGLHSGPDHVFTLANDMLSRMMGGRDILGRPLGEVLSDLEENAALLEHFDRVYATGEPYSAREVFHRITRDGETREGYYDEVYQAVRDEQGTVEGVMAFSLPVTEKVLARQALEDSRRRYQQLTEAMPQIVWTVTPDGALDYVNSRWRETTGSDFTPGIGGTEWIDRLVHPEDREGAKARFRKAVAEGAAYHHETRLRTAEGGYRWFLSRALPLRDDEGRVIRWLGTSTDIQDQKQAQAVLTQADRQKDTFLAMLAHELRNPLAPIRNAGAMMRLLPLNDPRLEEVAGIIERQVGHLARLVDDLLDVSRITRGRVELRREKVRLEDLVQGAVETVRPRLQSRRHDLSVELRDESLWLDADPVRMTQVLGNLLDNAAKYTPADSRIWLTAGRDGDDIEIRVRDQGQGIPQDKLDNIFELFFRMDDSLARSSDGLGLGLTLVRELVTLHHGAILVESPGDGQGSTFIVRLPAAEPIGMSPEAPAPKQAGLRRVLVVDDNEDAAQVLTGLLHTQGHVVEQVPDGPSALEAVETFQPEIVLLDIGLPGMDGYEVARRLHRNPERRPTLVAVTGYGDDEARHKAQEAGFDHHLLKPVGLDDLNRILAAADAP